MSPKKGNPAAQAEAEASAQSRREQARAKAQQMQAQADAAERRRRITLAAVAVVIIAALAVGITLVVRNASQSAAGSDASYGETGIIAMPAPEGAQAAPDNAVTVRVYSDYLCPACKSFEESADPYLAELAGAGTIKREYVPVAILDHLSAGSEYPTRAAAAAYCVAESDVNQLSGFTKALFAAQPSEGGPGPDNQQILTVAKQFIPNDSEMDACITDEEFTGYVGRVTDQASQDGMASTPTIMVDGNIIRPQENDTWLDALQREIAAAAAAKGVPAPGASAPASAAS